MSIYGPRRFPNSSVRNYHVLARGDGGKPVFEDDKNRYGWVDLLEKACERFGWRLHA